MKFGVFIATAAGVCVVLGLWQLDRLAQRRTANRQAERSRAAPVVDLATDRPEDMDQRRVRANGRFDAGRLFVLRGRPYRGSPGVQLVVPLQLTGSDTAVLVNLGFVPAADAVHYDRNEIDLPDDGPVTGLAQTIRVDEGSAQPVVSRGDTTWRHIELTAVSERLPYPVLPVMVRPPPDSTGGYPRALPAPALDDGPHLSYAIQWFSFATIALVGGALWLRERRNIT